jgi:dUTP pyrophosphatase
LYSTVTEGDRIAQLILERIYTPEVQEVEVSNLRHLTDVYELEIVLQNLDETIRGEKGFGSTGGHSQLQVA